MNGFLEKSEGERESSEDREKMSSGNFWKDIKNDLCQWSSSLGSGELVCIANFSLYDAMSAIELMDPKMDVGLLLKDRKIKSFEDGVESGALPMEDFSAVDYLSIIDRSLANFILWMEGNCLAQTVFTLVYLQKPEKISDQLLKAYCLSLEYIIFHVRRIMLDGSVVEEEDFQVSSMCSPFFGEHSNSNQTTLLKNLKASEEFCNKMSRKYRGFSKEKNNEEKNNEKKQNEKKQNEKKNKEKKDENKKDENKKDENKKDKKNEKQNDEKNKEEKNDENKNDEKNENKNDEKKQDVENDEYSQWTSLAFRFKFCRTTLQFFSAFDNKTTNFFEEAPSFLDALEETIKKILTGYSISREAFEKAPGFEGLINLHLLPPSFPRHTPPTWGVTDGGTFFFFQEMVRQLRIVLSVRQKLKSLEGLMFFIKTEGSSLNSALCRSMMQIVIFSSIGLKSSSNLETNLLNWQIFSSEEFMTESLRVFSNPPVLSAAFLQYENHGQMKVYVQTFIQTCVVLSSTLLRVQGLNKARQRDGLACCLVDLFSLQDDAEKLDEYFNSQLTELKLDGLNHTFCFGSWTLTTMLSSMSDYLFCGLELELYANTELHFIYWYLFDVLLHCQVQTILRADSAARQNELAWNILQEGDSKLHRKNTGKRKPFGRSKNVTPADTNRPQGPQGPQGPHGPQGPQGRQGPHGLYLGRAQTLHHLCGAFHFALLGLQGQEKIKVPDHSLECEEFRYYHRLMPFMERNAPAFVDYEHYEAVRSIVSRNNFSLNSSTISETFDAKKDVFTKSSFHFQQADRFLSSWRREDEKIALSKLCKRNDVIVKILATGRNVKSVDMKFDLHCWFPSLTIS